MEAGVSDSDVTATIRRDEAMMILVQSVACWILGACMVNYFSPSLFLVSPKCLL